MRRTAIVRLADRQGSARATPEPRDQRGSPSGFLYVSFWDRSEGSRRENPHRVFEGRGCLFADLEALRPPGRPKRWAFQRTPSVDLVPEGSARGGPPDGR